MFAGLKFAFCVSIVAHCLLFPTIIMVCAGGEEAQLSSSNSALFLTLVPASAIPEEPTEIEPQKNFLSAVIPVESASRTRARVASKSDSRTTNPASSTPDLIPVKLEAPILVSIAPSGAGNADEKRPDSTEPRAIELAAADISQFHGDVGSTVESELATGNLSSVGSVRDHPVYRKNSKPIYPLIARRRGEEGTVLLNVRVTATGKASRVEIKESSGFPILDTAALEGVRRWKFEPARTNSACVESEIEVPIRFKLSAGRE